ncbi:MAG TPA: hypothetical protein VGO58_04180, partial [Chitinophagaceae bacterium]|nr:hypothetical protein [Chitinophagaceae bacterium]
NTAIQSGMHEKLVPFYFFETPQRDILHDDHLLTSEDWTSSIRLKRLFSGINKKNIVVMIYSDAGALKNNYDPDRVSRTLAFIDQLHHLAAYIVWVNPAPENRWPGTNAEPISLGIPMYETERSAVVTAISVLKGKAPVST